MWYNIRNKFNFASNQKYTYIHVWINDPINGTISSCNPNYWYIYIHICVCACVLFKHFKFIEISKIKRTLNSMITDSIYRIYKRKISRSKSQDLQVPKIYRWSFLEFPWNPRFHSANSTTTRAFAVSSDFQPVSLRNPHFRPRIAARNFTKSHSKPSRGAYSIHVNALRTQV